MITIPFSSERQRRYMWAVHRKIAHKWADEAEDKNEPQVQPKKKKSKKK